VTGSRAGRLVLGATLLLVLSEALLQVAGLPRAAVTFDSGPNSGPHVTGFTPSEEHVPLTLRWTHGQASIRIPLDASAGTATLAFRSARFVDWPTRIRFFVGGQPAGSFTATPGGFRFHQLEFQHVGGPLHIDILSDDPELGIALDWLRIEGVSARLSRSVWQARLLPVGAFLLASLAGLGGLTAFGTGLATALAVAALAACDPFAAAHVIPRIALPALGSALTAYVIARRQPGAALVALIVLASFLIKGAALFHPTYFYNDVRQNHRYVRALARVSGNSLERRNRTAQEEVGVAYPRIVGGRKYAFPYSPVFYLPFIPLTHPDTIVDSIKYVALSAAAAEALAVFALALLLGGQRFAVLAALISAFLPPIFNRMLFAMWSTVTAHLMDVLAVCAIALLARRPQSPQRLFLVWATVQASLLMYVSSLFNLAALILCISALDRKLARQIVPVWALASATTVLWLYRDFTWLFLTEILPTFLSAGSGESAPPDSGGLLAALSRIGLFYGPLTPLLAAVGLYVWRRITRPECGAIVYGYALAVALLLVLRGLVGGLFKDLKELELAAPLVALAVAAALDALRRKGQWGRFVAAALVAATISFGLLSYADSFFTHSRLIGL
jgi:hypothetical protein